jgi:hypothetical protein
MEQLQRGFHLSSRLLILGQPKELGELIGEQLQGSCHLSASDSLRPLTSLRWSRNVERSNHAPSKGGPTGSAVVSCESPDQSPAAWEQLPCLHGGVSETGREDGRRRETDGEQTTSTEGEKRLSTFDHLRAEASPETETKAAARRFWRRESQCRSGIGL